MDAVTVTIQVPIAAPISEKVIIVAAGLGILLAGVGIWAATRKRKK